MDKVPMTAADMYPETGPSRTRVSSAPPPRPPLHPRGDHTEEKAGLRKLLGTTRKYPNLWSFLWIGTYSARSEVYPRRRFLEARGRRGLAGGRGLPRESPPRLALQLSLLRAVLFLLLPAPEPPRCAAALASSQGGGESKCHGVSAAHGWRRGGRQATQSLPSSAS